MPNPQQRDFGEPVPRYAPIVYSPRENDWVTALPGTRLLTRVQSTEVGGRYAVAETITSAGSAGSVHCHAEDELCHVLSGTMIFMVGGEIASAPAGTTVVIPAGTPHALRNRSDAPVHMLVTFTPGGMDELVEQLAGLSPDDLRSPRSLGSMVIDPPRI